MIELGIGIGMLVILVKENLLGIVNFFGNLSNVVFKGVVNFIIKFGELV